MRKIERSEIMDLGSYEQVRERFVQRMIEAKRHRRLHVGEHMTFIFENRDTVLFQIQEMLRVERITQEDAIQHELDTYNTMVPGKGELFTTLMIEYEDRETRHRMLDRLTDLSDHLVLYLGERKARPEFETLPGERPERLPAVNYVRFRVGEDAASILLDTSRGCGIEAIHPAYSGTTEMGPETRKQLASELEEN